MDIPEFITKWQKVDLTESAASQEHFLDLCELVGHPKPAQADPTGESFTFERGASIHGGGEGWADVWKKGFFGWEYKGKHKDLDAAYDQLLKYRESLENPRLLIVCDMDRIVIHTNFTATPVRVYDIPLSELGDARNLEMLRATFHDPDKLKPGATSEAITAEAASHLAPIAQTMRERGLPPVDVARMLDRDIFCLFAEDIGLLPAKVFTTIVDKAKDDPKRFTRLVGQLFDAMAHGGDFGPETIRYFNGNLFDTVTALELTPDEIERIHRACLLDWSAVDPSVFGTLFERGLDPDKRSQLGAHYTSRQDIEPLVEAVVMQPLRREWNELRQTVLNLLATGKKTPSGKDTGTLSPATRKKARAEADRMVRMFQHHLATVKVLDPACGSGNFLYVTLQKLMDLEKEVILFAMEHLGGGLLPRVRPEQLYGIEINPYAFELAQMAVWIGYLQWSRQNGFAWGGDPVLTRMDNFRCMDAILDLSDPEHPKEPEWPAVDFIVSNPPFLGSKMMRDRMGDDYVDSLLTMWRDRVRAESDLCCYWFEKARAHIQQGRCTRAGLLATQGIRGGASRDVLRRIKESGDIFFAESDRPWFLDGANVHVSMIGFDAGTDQSRTLDGRNVSTINANLGCTADTTKTRQREANKDIAYMSDTKGGAFDIDEDTALRLLLVPNPNERPSSDVVVPWINGKDLTSRSRLMWIIDFGVGKTYEEAALYELAFAYVRSHVKPQRDHNARECYRRLWWRHMEARPGMRNALDPLPRFVATAMVSKYRLFAWIEPPVLPDHQLIVFARSDDYFFGVLHSRLHEVWALKLGTRLETRPRYTPTTCFETFPFPQPTPDQQQVIAAAAKELDTLRNNWLNPPEWTREEILEFPGSVDGPWARYVQNPDPRGIGTVRYPRIVAKDAESATLLKKRTLTNLYNERPTWLDLAHKRLDEAVFAAYGWAPSLTDDQIIEQLLALNLAATQNRNGCPPGSGTVLDKNEDAAR